MLAVVPVSAPPDAKRRLARLLDAGERAALVRAMLEDVLDACRQARSIERILVVTPDPAIAPPDVDVLVDQGAGHAAAIGDALRQARDGALVVMADCPLVLPETLDALAEAARPVALCPAQDGGTNAIALRPADAVEPAFGLANGAAVVTERARAAGFVPVVLADARVALDVDTPADLERVRGLAAGTRTHDLLTVSAAGPGV